MNSVINGNTANVAIKGAILLLVVLVGAITYIIGQGEEVPEIFRSSVTLLIGFLIGTRTVSNGVKEEIMKKETEKRE